MRDSRVCNQQSYYRHAATLLIADCIAPASCASASHRCAATVLAVVVVVVVVVLLVISMPRCSVAPVRPASVSPTHDSCHSVNTDQSQQYKPRCQQQPFAAAFPRHIEPFVVSPLHPPA